MDISSYSTFELLQLFAKRFKNHSEVTLIYFLNTFKVVESHLEKITYFRTIFTYCSQVSLTPLSLTLITQKVYFLNIKYMVTFY